LLEAKSKHSVSTGTETEIHSEASTKKSGTAASVQTTGNYVKVNIILVIKA